VEMETDVATICMSLTPRDIIISLFEDLQRFIIKRNLEE
jgi:hypothetical protein